jgi:hypothetical protein
MSAQAGYSKFAYGTTSASYATGNVAAGTTDSSLVAAVPGRKIRVLAVAFICGTTATNATFNSKGSGAGTAISPIFQNGASSGAILGHNPVGWFQTNAGEGLTLTTGGGSTTGVIVVHVVV